MRTRYMSEPGGEGSKLIRFRKSCACLWSLHGCCLQRSWMFCPTCHHLVDVEPGGFSWCSDCVKPTWRDPFWEQSFYSEHFSCCSEQLIAGGQETRVPRRVRSLGSRRWGAVSWLVNAWILPLCPCRVLIGASDAPLRQHCMVWLCKSPVTKFLKGPGN